MRVCVLILILFLTIPILLLSKVSIENDTIRGANSDIIDIRIYLDELKEESILEFDLIVSNPSVCTINEITSNNLILTSSITNENRGKFSIKMKVDKEITDFNIQAKLLSGNDSLSTISLEKVLINGVPSIGDSSIIYNTFTNNIGPYYRFLFNSSPYPNPLRSGDKATITIFNDKEMSLKVYVHNSMGQLYGYKKIKYERGEHNIELKTEGYAAGTYFISGYTELGNFFEKIVVYK